MSSATGPSPKPLRGDQEQEKYPMLVLELLIGLPEPNI